MQRVGLAILFLLACGACALAAGYDDFARGTTANNQYDNDAAIAAFTAALSAGDLSPNLQPVAHYERATAYIRKGKCALAKADADAALQAKPDYLNALLLRANANSCAGQFDASLADYSTALAQRDVADGYFGRGVVYWQMDRFKEASADFTQAVARDPKDPYGPLWLALASLRSDPSNIAPVKDATDKIDGDDWPAPVIALYLGKAKPTDIEAAAAQGEAPAIPGQQCEADFYIAEWHLLQNDVIDAKPLLDNAVAHCPRRLERGMAIFERDRMK